MGLTEDATSEVGCAAGIVVTASVVTVASLEFWREGTHSQGPSNTMGPTNLAGASGGADNIRQGQNRSGYPSNMT